MKKVQTMGAPVALLVLTGVLLLAGCRDILTDPAPAGPASLALSVVMPEGHATQTTQSETGLAMSPGAAFDQADQIRIQLRGEAGTRMDVERAFRPQGAETRVRVEVDLEEEEEVAITLALLRQGAPLFEGEGTVTLEPGEQSSVVLELRGIVAGLEVETAPVEFDALGDRESLSARAVFATGQTVPGATPSWTSRNPSVARIVGGTQVEAVSEGATELVARVGSHEASVAVRVRQAVDQVGLSPSEFLLPVGEIRDLQISLSDPNGNFIPPAGRSVQWTSSRGTVATVSATGRVMAVGAGTATITATVDGVAGQASVEVVDEDRVEIITTTVPDGQVGQAFQVTFQARGGTEPYTWRVVSGRLPNPVELEAESGRLQGVVREEGTFSFTIEVEDAEGRTARRTFSTRIAPLDPGGAVFLDFNGIVQGTANTAPIRDFYRDLGVFFSPNALAIVRGNFENNPAPPGSLFFIDGSLVNMSYEAGFTTFSFYYSASEEGAVRFFQGVNSTGARVGPEIELVEQSDSNCPDDAVTFYCNWTLVEVTLPAPARSADFVGLANRIAVDAVAFNPVGTAQFDLAPAEMATGVAAGPIPEPEAEARSLRTPTLVPSLREAVAGEAYNAAFEIRGGGEGVQWRIRGGTLPEGLEFDAATGRIHGVPEASGGSSFVVEVKDDQGRVGSALFRLEVESP